MSAKTLSSGNLTQHPSNAEPATAAHKDESIASFLCGVGRNVRNAREKMAVSRKLLSERSGISERYLAQLEAGSGNISVVLLWKVARALDLEPTSLIPGDETEQRERELLILFRNADKQKRRDIIAGLRATDRFSAKAQRYCLIGLRGAGKTTLGQFAAKKLGFEFVELNDAIERQCGMAVSEIMALYGQEGYRNLEREAIEVIAESRQKVILAAGGGIVSDTDTLATLMTSFHSIWLKAAPNEHMSRVLEQGDNRPIAGNPRAMEELERILKGRETLYAQADQVVNTTGRTLRDSQRDLLDTIVAIEGSNPLSQA